MLSVLSKLLPSTRGVLALWEDTHNTHHPVGRGGREQARARLRKTRPTPMKGKSLIKVTHSLRFRVEAGRRRKLKVMSASGGEQGDLVRAPA